MDDILYVACELYKRFIFEQFIIKVALRAIHFLDNYRIKERLTFIARFCRNVRHQIAFSLHLHLLLLFLSLSLY